MASVHPMPVSGSCKPTASHRLDGCVEQGMASWLYDLAPQVSFIPHSATKLGAILSLSLCETKTMALPAEILDSYMTAEQAIPMLGHLQQTVM